MTRKQRNVRVKEGVLKVGKSELSLSEAIAHCEEVADRYCEAVEDGLKPDDFCDKCASEHRQLAEWLKRLKRIEDYIADGKDDMECTYSLCFWEIEAVMDGEIWRSEEVKADGDIN